MAVAQRPGEPRDGRQRRRDRARAAACRRSPECISARSASMPSHSARIRCAHASARSPSGVSSSNRCPRRTSGTPNSSSSRWIASESVAWETWQAAAARPKWRSRARAFEVDELLDDHGIRSINSGYREVGRNCCPRAPERGQLEAPSRTGALETVSKNLVELIRRHHGESAPTALEVLKDASSDNGELTDADRREAAERSGLPEATVYGVSTFYDDLLQPRGARHVRVCTGTACFAATGDEHVDADPRGARARARRAQRRRLGLARRDRLPRLLPFLAGGPRRRHDRRRPGRRRAGPRRRVRAGRGARVGVGARRAGADPARRLVRPAPRARASSRPRSSSTRSRRPRCAAAAAPASRPARSGRSPRAAEGDEKFIVANGDEGDPGSYIDKYLMERSPALLLEGMALAGYAVGAEHGFVLTRSEYPLSKPLLEAAASAGPRAGLARHGHRSAPASTST